METYFRLDLYVAGINYFMVNILLIAEGLDGDEPCMYRYKQSTFFTISEGHLKLLRILYKT